MPDVLALGHTLTAATALISSHALALLAVSFGVGIVIGLTGMGGGALMTPALIMLGIPPAAAVANDLVAAAVNKSVGAAVHWRKGAPNKRLAGWLVLGSVPSAFAGAFIIHALGADDGEQTIIKLAIGGTLCLTATTYTLRMYIELRRRQNGGEDHRSAQVRPLPTLLVGIAGGLLVGLTSVGSGSLIMMALLLLYPALSARKLVGTDLVQAVPLVISAAVSHLIVTGVDWRILVPLIVGGTPGTYCGARLANWVSESVIRRGIVLVLALTGITMLGVPTAGVVIIGAAMIVLGPLVWGFARRSQGLQPFENIPVPTGRIHRDS